MKPVTTPPTITHDRHAAASAEALSGKDLRDIVDPEEVAQTA